MIAVVHYLVLVTYLGWSRNILTASETVKIENDSYYPALNWSDPLDWKLLKAHAVERKNLLLSPVSLRIALALLYQGSSGNTLMEFQNIFYSDKNTTRIECQQILKALQASEGSGYDLDIGTRIFLDSKIEPKQKFAALAKEFFDTEITPTNFQDAEDAAKVINSWVMQVTHGRISQLVNPDDLQDDIMLISNAVFFKSSWKYPFPKNETTTEPFYVHDEELGFKKIPVEYVSARGKYYYVESPTFDAKILRLPYKGGNYSMFIILPNSKGGLPILTRQINMHTLKNLLYLMDLRTVDVNIPKFKFKYQADFKNTLQNFGLYQMFENTASFPGIARGNNTLLKKLVVSEVIQKSGIELDEEGSVAYAATAVKIGVKFGQDDFRPPVTFNAQQPFLFFIEEESSGSILFIGKVENPMEG